MRRHLVVSYVLSAVSIEENVCTVYMQSDFKMFERYTALGDPLREGKEESG